MPNFEPVLVQALDQQVPVDATMLNKARLDKTLEEYHKITQKIARVNDKIRLIDEMKQKAALQPVSAEPFSRGDIIRSVEQQQEVKVPSLQQMLPTSVYPWPVTFVDNAPVWENPPYHSSFSSSPSSPQFDANSSNLHALLSNVGQGIIHGEHVQLPLSDGMDDDFHFFASQIFEPSKVDGDSNSVLLSNELEEEFMNPISF